MSTMTINFSTDKLVRDLKRAALGLAIFAGITMLAHCGTGCLPAQGPNTLEQNYTTDIIACAAMAGYPGEYDREEDMRCRHDVDCKYHLASCQEASDAGR